MLSSTCPFMPGSAFVPSLCPALVLDEGRVEPVLGVENAVEQSFKGAENSVELCDTSAGGQRTRPEAGAGQEGEEILREGTQTPKKVLKKALSFSEMLVRTGPLCAVA